VRRLRQVPQQGELSLSETAALARLDRGGPSTASKLAKLEQISPQSMGATLSGLEARGLVERGSDPQDARLVVLSITERGLRLLGDRRSVRTERLGQALAAEFSPEELERLSAILPLLERLGERI
jgi:DNA-binding MarR family transcriptional regulator